jgi:hypothetical protein
MIKNLMKKLRSQQPRQLSAELSVDSSGPTVSSINSIRFEIHKASGGIVVETRRYNRAKDDTIHGLYIITEDQDIGVELKRIITMESLKA